MKAENEIRTTPIVECISSSTYAERPVAFVWENERLEVVAIEKQWRTPAGVGFRVQTRLPKFVPGSSESIALQTSEVCGGQIFELFYGEEEDEWSIHQP